MYIQCAQFAWFTKGYVAHLHVTKRKRQTQNTQNIRKTIQKYYERRKLQWTI